MTGIMHQMLGQANVAGSSGLFIAADTPNVNIRAILLANGWNGTSIVTANLVIAASATVWSTSIATPALDTGAAFPLGSSITITNNGKILGRGGKGGSWYLNAILTEDLISPQTGGPALKAQSAITVINNGIISGGGGGGGAGGIGRSAIDAYGGQTIYDSGPGGGGMGNGSPGYQGAYVYHSAGGATSIGQPAHVANAGTLLTGGVGGTGASGKAGGGGSGGGYASAGGAGGAGYDSSLPGVTAGQTGGTGGVATIGNANITWSVTGTIYGALT